MAKRKRATSAPDPIQDKVEPVQGKSTGDVIIAIVAIFTLACVALQPVSSDYAWWQLSCGRQVITQGSLWPSVDLLVNESQGEANAIGAAAATVVYWLLGASGWMIVRVAAVFASAGLLCLHARRWKTGELTPDHKLSTGLACLTISLAALAPYLDPVPIMFDVIATGLVAVWIIRQSDLAEITIGSHCLSLSFLFLFWANFGNHVFVGLSMIVVAGLIRSWQAVEPSETRKRRALPAVGIAVAAVSATINPIGWRVWGDSLSQSLPWAIAPHWTLVGTDWVPLTQVEWEFSHYVFLLLTLLTCILLWVSSLRHNYFAVTLVLQLFAWCSAVNLPLAIVWMTVLLLAFKKNWSVDRQRMKPVLAFTAMAVVCAVMIRSVGWGFDAALDPRMLDIAIADVRDDGTILTDDSRSTGMMAWVLGPVQANELGGRKSARLQDEPRRALVGGRLLEHRRLFADLRDSQQMSYWRDDESQGGWWLPLTLRKTSLIAFSRHDLKLIRRLEPTIWKPLSLDSPVLLYARAGDPIYTPKIVDVLGQRDFVNSGMWSYQPPPSTGSVYDRDRFGVLPAVEQANRTFEQAAVFAAMDLQIAALEVLNYAQRQWPGTPRYVNAWQRCQIELADWERVNTGQASWLRTMASIAFNGNLDQANADAQEFDLADVAISDAEIRHWKRLIASYRTEGAAAALQASEQVINGGAPSDLGALSQSSRDQLRYAAVCWAIESGRRGDAMRWAATLKNDQSVSQEVRLLAHHQLVSKNWMEDTNASNQEIGR